MRKILGYIKPQYEVLGEPPLQSTIDYITRMRGFAKDSEKKHPFSRIVLRNRNGLVSADVTEGDSEEIERKLTGVPQRVKDFLLGKYSRRWPLGVSEESVRERLNK